MSKINATAEEERHRILKARAALLAQERKESGAEGELIKIVEFLLADERYGIESMYIAEVYPLKELTPIPCTPPFVLGVINLRGKILSVIDLRTFFELHVNGFSDINKIIVLSNDEMEFGILADAIIDARWIPRSELLPSLPTLTGVRNDYLMGVTQDRLVVLDGGKLLSDSSIVVHEEV
jgi:purine-binding chemotaxis protein CheW